MNLVVNFYLFLKNNSNEIELNEFINHCKTIHSIDHIQLCLETAINYINNNVTMVDDIDTGGTMFFDSLNKRIS